MPIITEGDVANIDEELETPQIPIPDEPAEPPKVENVGTVEDVLAEGLPEVEGLDSKTVAQTAAQLSGMYVEKPEMAGFTADELFTAAQSDYTKQAAQILFDSYIEDMTGYTKGTTEFDKIYAEAVKYLAEYVNPITGAAEPLTVDDYYNSLLTGTMQVFDALFAGFGGPPTELPPASDKEFYDNYMRDELSIVSAGFEPDVFLTKGDLTNNAYLMSDGTYLIPAVSLDNMVFINPSGSLVQPPDGYSILYAPGVDGAPGKILAYVSPNGVRINPDGTVIGNDGKAYTAEEFATYVDAVKARSGGMDMKLMDALSMLNPDAELPQGEGGIFDKTLGEFMYALSITDEELLQFYNGDTALYEDEFVKALRTVLSTEDPEMRTLILTELGITENEKKKLNDLVVAHNEEFSSLMESLKPLGKKKAGQVGALLGIPQSVIDDLFPSVDWKQFFNFSMPPAYKEEPWYKDVADAVRSGIGTASYALKQGWRVQKINALIVDKPVLGDMFMGEPIPQSDALGLDIVMAGYANEYGLSDEERQARNDVEIGKIAEEIMNEYYAHMERWANNPEYMQSDRGMLNPVTWLEIIGHTLPLSAAIMASVGVGMGVGGPAGGVAVGTLVGQTAAMGDVYSLLVAGGMDPKTASDYAFNVGLVSGAVESLSDMVVLGAVSPVFHALKGNFARSLSQGVASTAIKMMAQGVKVSGTEVMEEIIQGALANAALKSVYDIPIMSVEELTGTALETLIATSPFAFLGMGGVRMSYTDNMARVLDSSFGTLDKQKPASLLKGLKVTVPVHPDVIAGMSDADLKNLGYKKGTDGQWHYTQAASKMFYEVYKKETANGVPHKDALLSAYNQVCNASPEAYAALVDRLDLYVAGKVGAGLVQRISDWADAKLAARDKRPEIVRKKEIFVTLDEVNTRVSKSKNPLVNKIQVDVSEDGLIRSVKDKIKLIEKEEAELQGVARSSKYKAQMDRAEMKHRAYAEEHGLESVNDIPIETRTRLTRIAQSEIGPMERFVVRMEFTEAEIAAMRVQFKKAVYENKSLSESTRANYGQAFYKLLNSTNEDLTIDERRLLPHEIKKLGQVFGSDFENALRTAYTIEHKYNNAANTAWQKSVAVASKINMAARFLQTVGDWSAVFRQGFGLVGMPKEFARAFIHAAHAAKSEAYMRQHNAAMANELFNRWGDIEEMYLKGSGSHFFTELDAALSEREEAIGMNFLQDMARTLKEHHMGALAVLPTWFDRLVAEPSNRHYATFLNTLRYETYTHYAKMLDDAGMYENNKDAYVNLMEGVSFLTGRGQFGKYSKYTQELSAIFYAPKLAISYPQRVHRMFASTASAAAGDEGQAVVARMMARNMMASLGASYAMARLAMYAFNDDDENPLVTFSLDPRSTYFGKLRFGNTTIDISGGASTYIRLAYQVATGERLTTGTGAEAEADRVDTIIRFLRGKLGPMPGIFFDVVDGTNYTGKDIDVFKTGFYYESALELFIPMAWKGAYEAFKNYADAEDPSTWVFPIIAALAEASGFNATTWDNRTYDEIISSAGMLNPNFGLLKDNGTMDTDMYISLDNLYGDMSAVLKGITSDMLTPEFISRYNYDPLTVLFIQTRDLERMYSDMHFTTPLVELNADSTQGGTYHDMFKAGKITEDEYALLNRYWELPTQEAKDAFLKQHPTLAMTGSEKDMKWLLDNPQENAMLALWGKADIMSRAAYEAMMVLMEEHGLTEQMVPKNNLPSPEFIDDHFDFIALKESLGETYTLGSDEVQLWRLEHPEYNDYMEWTVPSEAAETLKLKIQYKDEFAYLDSLSDEKDPNYIYDDDARDEAKKTYLVEHQPFYEAYIRKEFLTDGTEGMDQEKVREFIEYKKQSYHLGASSSEAMLLLAENKDLHKWMLENDLITRKVEDVKPAEYYKLDIQIAPMDGDYEAARAVSDDMGDAFLLANTEYARMYYARKAYGDYVSKGLAEEYVPDYVEWQMKVLSGKEGWLRDYPDFATHYTNRPNESIYFDEWWLMENKGFYNNMVRIGGMAKREFNGIPSPEEIKMWAHYCSLKPYSKERQYYRAQNRGVFEGVYIRLGGGKIVVTKTDGIHRAGEILSGEAGYIYWKWLNGYI